MRNQLKCNFVIEYSRMMILHENNEAVNSFQSTQEREIKSDSKTIKNKYKR